MPYDGSVLKLLPLALSVVLAALAALPVGAIPLQVRARTELSARVDQVGEGVVLRGQLKRDDGGAVEKAAVRVRLKGGSAREVFTNERGEFEISLRPPPPENGAPSGREESYRWEAEFDGDSDSGPASASGLLEDARAASSISLELEPRTLTLDSGPARALVSVRAGAEPVGSVPVFLSVGDGAELVGATDADGDVAFLLHPDALEQHGRLEVSARWAGDHRYGSAQVRRSLRVLLPTRLSLRVAREGALESGRYRFSGRLGDHRGGVAGATVALRYRRDDAPSDGPAESGAVAQTDARGHFVFAIPTQQLAGEAPGAVAAEVVYVPGDGRHASARSYSARLPVPGPPGVSAQWYAAVAMLAAAFLILLDLVRSGGLSRWTPVQLLARWRATRSAGPAPQATRAVQREPRRDWVSARFSDSRTGAGLDHVSATLVSLTDHQEVRAQPDALEWGPLAHGSYRLQFHAHGYLRQHVEIVIPHDGSMDPLHQRLVEVRGHVLLAFSQALARLGIRFRWGAETPAEAMARRPEIDPESDHALRGLHENTEALWFANRAPEREDAQRADLLLAKVEERS